MSIAPTTSLPWHAHARGHLHTPGNPIPTYSGNASGNKIGKIGNAARLLTRAIPAAPTTPTPEKISTRKPKPIPATPPAMSPAKTARIPAMKSAKSALAYACFAHERKGPARAVQMATAPPMLTATPHETGITTGNPGNKIGNPSGNPLASRPRPSKGRG